MRRLIKKQLTASHNDYVLDLLGISKCNEDGPSKYSQSKKCWSFIRAKRRDATGIPNLQDNGIEYTDAKSKAEILSSQYKSVFTQEVETEVPMNEKGSIIPNIQDLTIQCKGVEKLLEKLNPSKACGPDKISTGVLKEASLETSPILPDIFNRSILTGDVPSSWRKGNIVAVYKGKGRKYHAAYYRPVSMTSVPCKILEHVIHRHIMNHCEQYNIILNNQHGFRAKRSCETQLIETIEDIARNINFGNVIDLLILDFSKAFDTVSC